MVAAICGGSSIASTVENSQNCLPPVNAAAVVEASSADLRKNLALPANSQSDQVLASCKQVMDQLAKRSSAPEQVPPCPPGPAAPLSIQESGAEPTHSQLLPKICRQLSMDMEAMQDRWLELFESSCACATDPSARTYEQDDKKNARTSYHPDPSGYILLVTCCLQVWSAIELPSPLVP